jgi:hypothetical protein
MGDIQKSKKNQFILLSVLLLTFSHSASAAFAGSIVGATQAKYIIQAVAGVVAIAVIAKLIDSVFVKHDSEGLLWKSILTAGLVAVALKPDLLTSLFANL